MNKKIIIGVVIAIIAIVGVFVLLNLRTETKEITREVIKGEDEVRPFITVTDNWEPHAYSDENGVARGIAVEVVDRIFSKLGVDYEVRFYPWIRVMKEVETGSSDASFVTSYTPERAEFLYYVEEGLEYIEEPFPPYYTTISDTVFFVRQQTEDAVEFDTPEEIVEKGYRVGVISGYYSAGKMYETGIDPNNVVEYFDTESGMQGLANGEVDIYLQEKAVGFRALEKMELTDMITSMTQLFFQNPQYVAFSKKSDYPNLNEFRVQFLEEMRKIHESGEYDEMYSRYIQE